MQDNAKARSALEGALEDADKRVAEARTDAEIARQQTHEARMYGQRMLKDVEVSIAEAQTERGLRQQLEQKVQQLSAQLERAVAARSLAEQATALGTQAQKELLAEMRSQQKQLSLLRQIQV